MTITDSVILSWSSLFDVWEKQDPTAFEYFYHFHAMNGVEEEDLSPYERLTQINEIQGDSNEEFFDSLVNAVETAYMALPEFASCNCPASIPDIDFCEDGVHIDF